MRVGIYCLDQDRETTSTMGVYNYTRNLIGALSLLEDPGVEVVLLLSERNKYDMCPEVLPAWMQVHVEPRCCAQGLRRLWADHVLTGRCAAKYELDVVHYPKGWMPLFPIAGIVHVVTIHDVINFLLRSEYVSVKGRLKAGYFSWMTRHALRRADLVITVSKYSRQKLTQTGLVRDDQVEVVYQGPGLQFPSVTGSPFSQRNSFLIVGSETPHKATRETLFLLNQYAVGKNMKMKIYVTGLVTWPVAWGECLAQLDIEFLGRVSDERMVQLMHNSRALLFLSREEGFGLPAIEAYQAGTPVCYRKASSLAEVMGDFPGGWDGSFDHFAATLDEVLSLDEVTVATIRKKLEKKFSWTQAAREVCQLYVRCRENE